MSNLFIQTYVTVLSVVLTALMGYIVWLLKEQRKQKAVDIAERNARIKQEQEERNNNSRGTMLLLMVQLIEYHDKYMDIGNIPSYAYKNFTEMYKVYNALGGDGMITKMMHEIEGLHLKKKEEGEYE